MGLIRLGLRINSSVCATYSYAPHNMLVPVRATQPLKNATKHSNAAEDLCFLLDANVLLNYH